MPPTAILIAIVCSVAISVAILITVKYRRAQRSAREFDAVLELRIANHEAEADTARQLYQLLAENATDMISTHSVDGAFEYTTPNWSEYTGITSLGLISHSPVEYCHPDDRALQIANYRRALGSDDLITTEWRCQRPDGAYGWVETTTRTLRKDGSRTVRKFVCATRDITKRREAEAAVRDSEARYRMLLEQAADAILITNSNGQCIEVNARACTLLGREDAQIIGMPIRSLFIARDAARGSLLSALNIGDVVTAEDVAVHGNGAHVPVEISVAVLGGGGAQIIARDISSRKELERLKGEFVSVVSHELRTPLTSIRGALGLLASGRLADSPEKSTRMLDLAVTNTDRLIRLINDILDAERIAAGTIAMERSWCDAMALAQQVADSLQPLADRAGVELRIIGEPVRVWADPSRVTQTLTNLIGNAIKFSPEKSAIDIRIRSDIQDIRFEIRDRGRGVPADKLESIFDRFQQVDGSDAREKGGTGLGLAVCRSIVSQHGGKIWAESTLGEGSLFCFTIPLPLTAREETVDGPPGLLVCDDDPALLEVLRAMLEARGFTVTTASSGAQAIERAQAKRPVAILLDMVMPGMSGRETLMEFRTNEAMRDIPVILMSGAMPIGDADGLGVVDWLSKPIEEECLLRALALIVHTPRVGKPRVLVVEDDRALGQVIATTLESHGYDVNVTHSGAGALSCYQATGADAIILDLALPDMNGLDVLDSIRASAGSAVPALVFTATDPDASLRDRAREAGARVAIKSRTSPDALVELVGHLLESAPTLEPVAV